MSKKSVQSNLVSGYSAWSRSRTIDEAHNIARWNPWLAHDWMKEAIDGTSIADYDILEKHDRIATKINHLWRRRKSYRWYDEKEFWDGVPPKMISKCVSDDEYDIITNEEE